MHSPQHTVRTVPAHNSTGDRYTAQAIADEHPDISPAEVTVRTRWFPYLEKVAPSELLKDQDGYTELARSLFEDFAQHVKRNGMKPMDWVEDAKGRYSHEWASVGIIDGELMPEDVGGALATLRQSGSTLQQQIADELRQLQAFTEQIQEVEEDFSEAEMELFRAKGIARGLKRYRLETQAELETYSHLKQQGLKQ